VHSHALVVGLITLGALHSHSQAFEVELNLVPCGHCLHCLETGSKNFPDFGSHLTQ
jgi:hypothetical protein